MSVEQVAQARHDAIVATIPIVAIIDNHRNTIVIIASIATAIVIIVAIINDYTCTTLVDIIINKKMNLKGYMNKLASNYMRKKITNTAMWRNIKELEQTLCLVWMMI